MWVILLAALASAQATVSLVSAGSEPREVLRVEWRDGAQTYSESTRNHVQVQLGGLLTDPKAVDQTQRLRWIARSRQNTLDVELTHATLESTGEATLPDMSRLVGLTGSLTVDPQCRALSHAMTPPRSDLTKDEQDRMKALGHRIQQVALPLPEDPVGVGAVWRIRDHLDTALMRFDMVTTVTLIERRGNLVKVRLRNAIANVPTDVTVDLDGFSGKLKALDVSGRQDVTFRLDRPVALERNSRIQTHLVVRGWRGPFPVTVTMDVNQRIWATARESD